MPSVMKYFTQLVICQFKRKLLSFIPLPLYNVTYATTCGTTENPKTINKEIKSAYNERKEMVQVNILKFNY